ncbi:ankyrin repeat domain-containing protein [Chamaesiphon sp.]|uniref:ankyrin repeat domain-containing protein n=1 Tax=Chamaesiphon sp. TaxID=2814140 RepID=UPI0035940EC8
MSVDPQTQSLFDAIAAVNYNRVKLLIDLGVAIDRPNDRGQTPLALACQQGSLEIVDLLVAAGARMHSPRYSPPQSPSDVVLTPNPPATESQRSVLPDALRPDPHQQEIPFDNLIELLHQPPTANPTEVEQIVPIAPQPLVAEQYNTDLHRLVANWQDFSSDAEATYTFDLDEVFAANDALDRSATLDALEMFVDGDNTITSIQRPKQEIEFEAGETYAFDLSPDLDRLMVEANEEPDRLAMPMDKWEESATYVIDNLPPLTPVDTLPPDFPQQQLDHIAAIEARFETLPAQSIADEDRFVASATWEDNETYAIDLDDLSLPELLIDSTRVVTSERHLLGDIDASLFPVSQLGDDPQSDDDECQYYDPDTQTSTDIFGQSKTKSAELELAPIYEENATNTSLMAAVIDGDLDLALQAIEAGASLDRYDWNLGYSPLGMAIDRGYVDLVGQLLTAGANPHCGSTATTALGLAAERGEVEIIQMLLPRGVDINAPVGQDDWTALLSAIHHGHRSVVQLLVTAGANVNVWSRGETPILLAAKCEEREIYQYLYPLVNTAIRLCADRDGEQLLQATHKRRIRQQNRPVEKLIEMATMGNVDEVNRAIEIGIEVDELGAQGHTALMAAAYHGHRSIVNILLAAGADPNLLSDDDGLGSAGMTALMMAAGSFFASNRQHVVRLLIAGGADVNQRGVGGKTAIFYAALAGSGYLDCVETAIAAGADLDLQDDSGHTVLTAVAAAENYPLFNLLMQAGASTAGLESIQLIQAAGAGNVDRVRSLLATKVNLDLDRGAAIGSAAAAGHTQIVELLIRAGANVNLQDKLGFTPIASAAYAGYGEIVQLLIDAGADIHAPAGGSQSYSALEYAQMGLYQCDFRNEKQHQSGDRQHAQIVRQLQQLGAR